MDNILFFYVHLFFLFTESEHAHIVNKKSMSILILRFLPKSGAKIWGVTESVQRECTLTGHYIHLVGCIIFCYQ